jgi:hypothetical protein
MTFQHWPLLPDAKQENGNSLYLEYHFQTPTIHKNSENFSLHFLASFCLTRKKLNKQNDWETEKETTFGLFSLDLNIVLNVCFWHINEI